MRRWTVPAFFAFLLLQPLTARDAGSTDAKASWTQWRGPSGQGYCHDTKVPLTWSEKENVLWKVKLPGSGNSSPIVHGDRIFLTAATNSGAQRHVLCFRTTDGKLLWQQTAARNVPQERTHAWNGHASPSCTTDGQHVYAFFGSPGLFCYDMDGKLVWKKVFGNFISTTGWGTAASPFLEGDLVIQNCDNDGGPGAAPPALVALDKKTGEIRWSTPRNQGRGFGTPRLMKVAGGRTDLVLNGASGLWGYDPRTGKERWRSTRSDPNEKEKFGEPMAVDDGKHIYVASGRPGPFQILRMPGSGDVTKTHVVHAGRRDKHRDVSSPIVWQGRVYAADRDAVLSCYDLESGKELFNGFIGTRRGASKSLASPIALRGKLLWLLDDGGTVVVEPGDTLKIVGGNKLDGRALDFGASPAVADGRMFLRSQSHLYCIAAKGEK